MDIGYPKPLTNGFAGLSGKIRAALPVASYNGRPESVYFIKRGKSHISDVHKWSKYTWIALVRNTTVTDW